MSSFQQLSTVLNQRHEPFQPPSIANVRPLIPKNLPVDISQTPLNHIWTGSNMIQPSTTYFKAHPRGRFIPYNQNRKVANSTIQCGEIRMPTTSKRIWINRYLPSGSRRTGQGHIVFSLVLSRVYMLIRTIMMEIDIPLSHFLLGREVILDNLLLGP